VRFTSVLAVLLTVSVGLWLLRSRRSTGNTTSWLTVSKPIFAFQTNAQGIRPIIRVSVSNAGPQNLGFELAWLECRNRSNNNPLIVDFLPQGRGKKSTVLPPASATNFLMEVLTEDPLDQVPLCCCQLTWIEKESRLLHLATQVDKPMYWLANVVGGNWDPPWHRKRFAGGDVFTSNVEVAEYFSRAYGLSRVQWLAEQRSKQQMFDELARSQPTARFGVHRFGAFTAEQQGEYEAKFAFAVFCRTSTNLEGSGEPGAALNGGPGAPSPGSGVQEGRHR